MTAFLLAQPSAAAECLMLETLDAFAVTDTPPSGATCSTYLTATAAKGVSCHWAFAFRDKKGLLFADELWATLSTCRAGDRLGADQIVNHPDSYDLREWRTSSGTYAISVKDKGALNRTLVFLRFEPD
ncbi:MAG: hypothetical protein ACU0GG_10335 [Paracoccaceae bacterium]